MSTITRSLIVLAAFLVLNGIAFIAFTHLGIERGEWRYALSIGIVIALTSAAWRLTAPKKQTPP
jgi:hypothetical protein